MNSVEWMGSGEVAAGAATDDATRRWLSRLASSRLGRRLGVLSDVRARRISAVLLVLAFVLTVIAQWEPWFRLDAVANDFTDVSRAPGGRSIDALNALYVLAIPYYVGWTLIAMAAGAAVLGGARLRRAATGVAAGALAGQTLVVVTAWHARGLGAYQALVSPSEGPHTTAQSGMYVLIAALVMTALAVVVAVRGRIIPMADSPAEALIAGPVARPDEPFAPGTRRRVRAGQPWVDGGDEFDFAGPGPAHVNGSLGAGLTAIGETTSAAPSGMKPDHSLYMRPGHADAVIGDR